MSEHDLEVVEAMAKFGGSFVKALAECFRTADPQNFIKLKATFGNYWHDYETMAARNRLRGKKS